MNLQECIESLGPSKIAELLKEPNPILKALFASKKAWPKPAGPGWMTDKLYAYLDTWDHVEIRTMDGRLCWAQTRIY